MSDAVLAELCDRVQKWARMGYFGLHTFTTKGELMEAVDRVATELRERLATEDRCHGENKE